MLSAVEMKLVYKTGFTVLSSLALAACIGGGDQQVASTPYPTGPAGEVSDYPVKTGAPYTVAGTTYTPTDALNYDEVGYASWYGREHTGQPTASGEVFDPSRISAAHKTLPLPSYVEVTNLDTGRTILVRVNDRGPFANDRLIDLSEAAAVQLGMTDRGFTPVRVRRVNPLEQERSLLRSGKMASERIEAPEGLLKGLRQKLKGQPLPKVAARPAPSTAMAPVSTNSVSSAPAMASPPARTPVTPPSAPASQAVSGQPANNQSGRFIVEREGVTSSAPAPRSAAPVAAGPAPAPYYVVQVGAFSSRETAESLAQRIGASVFTNADGSIWRVRYGPYNTEGEAQAGLAAARRNGFDTAVIAAGN